MDDEAFAGLVRDYSRLIYTVCYRLVHNEQEAENLTQETFLTAYRAINRFIGDRYKPWLIRIAVNKSKDYLKSAAYVLTNPTELETLDTYPPPRHQPWKPNPGKSSNTYGKRAIICPSPTAKSHVCGFWRKKVMRRLPPSSAGRSKRYRRRACVPAKN